MKKTIYLFGVLIGLSVITTPSSQADLFFKSGDGGMVGNGGGTVVCRDANQKIIRIETLDYYEAAMHPGLTLDIDKIPGDAKAKVSALIERIRKKSELRYQLYTTWFNSFVSEQALLVGVEFSTVPDSGYISVPKGCKFEQAVIQRRPMFSKDPRYFINAELFTAMDDTQKAMLILHELVYREALAYGHTDSIRARYLNDLYASSQFADMDFKTYVETLKQAHFELTDQDSIWDAELPVETKLDLSRLWQASPDQEKTLEPLFLKGKIVSQLGVCLGDGCKTFKTFDGESVDTDVGTVLSFFHPAQDVLSLQFGSNTLKQGQINSSEGVDIQTLEKTKVIIFSIPGGTSHLAIMANPGASFELINNNRILSQQTVAANLNEISHHNYEWSSLESKFVLDLKKDPKDQELLMAMPCSSIASTWWAGKLMDAQAIGYQSCQDSDTAFIAFSFYENGTAIVSAYPNQMIEYSIDQEDVIKTTSWSAWSPKNLSNNLGTSCSYKNEKNKNCIHLKEVSDKNQVQAFMVTGDASSSYRFSLGHPGDSPAYQFINILGEQTIQLYPNGSPKVLSVGEITTVILKSGQTVTVEPKTILQLDEDAFVTSIAFPSNQK